MKRILAIDDNNIILISLKAFINAAFPDATLDLALNGPDGIELARAHDPDVILLDILMPGMDGFEVCSKLKHDECLRDIPVVFFTTLNGDKPNRIKALEVGAEGFLTKPLDETELIAQIRAMVKIKRANQQKRDEKARLAMLVAERTSELEQSKLVMERLLADLKAENEARRKTEAELKESEIRLRELNATKDKFFSIIAHDLRSPFNSIIGFSDLLVAQVNENNHDAIVKYATIIHDSSWQAMDLLENLMEWSQSQTGRMEFNPEYIEIVSLVNEVTQFLNISARQKAITIATELPGNIVVSADKAMITTVLRNLISNAIKFTNPGGKIVVSADQKNAELLITVRDNGVGMRQEIIDQLFRLDSNHTSSGTQNEKGTGLGLILCAEFIEKHGGKIWAESKEENGSTFCFTIPMAGNK